MADTPDYILSEHRRELTAEDYEWLRINCRKDSSLEATQRYAALLESHQELLKIVKQVFMVGITPDIEHVEKAIARAEGIG